MKIYILYLITNTLNGKYYVGWTNKTLQERWKLHLGNAKYDCNWHLHSSIRKYGKENFIMETLLVVFSEKEVKNFEKLWIRALGSYDPEIGYNMTMGGDGVIATKETKKKMSISHIGSKRTEESTEKQGDTGRELWSKRREQGIDKPIIDSLLREGTAINKAREDKTWEEIFGKEKAEQIRIKRRIAAEKRRAAIDIKNSELLISRKVVLIKELGFKKAKIAKLLGVEISRVTSILEDSLQKKAA